MAQSVPRFIAVADHAVLIEFGQSIEASITAKVQALDRAITSQPPTGVIEVTPAFVNLLVMFDPLLTDHESLIEATRALLDQADDHIHSSRLHDVPVCYESEFSPDLISVSTQTGLDESEVIAVHQDAVYTVGMYGFAPGYAYLSGTPEAIQVPRKTKAVRDVPVGSVMIAGAQCLITTLDMPTGWSVIGRSPKAILRHDSENPFLFAIGDQVRFHQIDQQTIDMELKKANREND
ncbi:MAG: 5-oxoprolinase subunit PxpB [Granulosicoccus sp.]|nr:5-oxoprolinase subunit PxpB [Granulosicoccus sp.]